MFRPLSEKSRAVWAKDLIIGMSVAKKFYSKIKVENTPLIFAPFSLLLSLLSTVSRLGVQELVLVDYDVVAASNVNRQVLFSSGDVGRRKVEAGEEGLQRHNIRTSQWQYSFAASTYSHKSIPINSFP